MSYSSFSAGSGAFPSFISVSLIDLLASLTLAVILVVLGIKFIRLNPSTTKLLKVARMNLGVRGLVRVFLSELVNRVFLQRDLISRERLRRFAHLCMFWGFVGLGITTTLDYFFNEPGNYIPLFGGTLSAIRWLGNISGMVMILGASIVLGRMIGVPKFRERLCFFDVWFAALLFLVGVTGFVTEFLGDVAYVSNPSSPPAVPYTISAGASPLIAIPYGTHIALIGLLFLSAPVSAFIHALRVPSLRYLDSVGKSLTENEEQSDTHKIIKEEIMVEQIREHYEKISANDKMNGREEEIGEKARKNNESGDSEA